MVPDEPPPPEAVPLPGPIEVLDCEEPPPPDAVAELDAPPWWPPPVDVDAGESPAPEQAAIAA
jgi:hypothetical protein